MPPLAPLSSATTSTTTITITTTVQSSEVTVLTGDEVMREMQAHQRTITRTMNHAYSGAGGHRLAALPTPPPSTNSQAGEVVTSSSPECEENEALEPSKMKGLRLFTQDVEQVLADQKRSGSPTIAIIKPMPRKAEGPLMTGGGNMTSVTLSLMKEVTHNVEGVLSAFSKLLGIKEPVNFEVINEAGHKERHGKWAQSPTPTAEPSLKISPEKTANTTTAKVTPVPTKANTKSSVIAGSLVDPKLHFCRHCDVLVVGEGVRKSTSATDQNVVFCSSACYLQYTISQRAQVARTEAQAGRVVNHRSSDPTGSQLTVTSPKPCSSLPTSPSALPKTPPHSKSTPISPRSQPAQPVVSSPVAAQPANSLSEANVATPTTNQEVSPAKESKEPAEVKKAELGKEADDDKSEDGREELRLTLKTATRRRAALGDDLPLVKKWKNIKWRRWHGSFSTGKKYRPPSDQDIDELIKKLGTSLRPLNMLPDTRACVLCGGLGDGDTDGPARLLNLNVDSWVHLNCALWSDEVYETLNGSLMNMENALKRGQSCTCCYCSKLGATISCHKQRCCNVYHFNCAIQDHCMFFKDKTMMCPLHAPSKPTESTLHSHVVYRRVYINRDEHKQVASIMTMTDRKFTLRVGSLVFRSLGQLLPHQMHLFHSLTSIYPVGYESIRLYWSMRYTNKRCSYSCTIQDQNGRPEFSIRIIEQGHEDITFKADTPRNVWYKVLEPIAKLRRDADMLKLFPTFLTGEDLFGLTESAVQRITESLPGVDLIQHYTFRFGRSPLIDLPLAVNPTGCARAEPRRQTHLKRPHTLTSNTTSRSFHTTLAGEVASPYNKQFVHSKSSQYKRLKTEWKTNVYLARSQIQGLGLYAAHDIEKHTMVIEYIGTLIRNEVANKWEREYEAANRGVYMFRLDDNTVVDATRSGNPARYINHSCNPNCVAEVVNFDKDQKKIIIISSRRLLKGEELTYDYKFELEDVQNKIPCLCKAPNCRKWMN